MKNWFARKHTMRSSDLWLLAIILALPAALVLTNAFWNYHINMTSGTATELRPHLQPCYRNNYACTTPRAIIYDDLVMSNDSIQYVIDPYAFTPALPATFTSHLINTTVSLRVTLWYIYPFLLAPNATIIAIQIYDNHRALWTMYTTGAYRHPTVSNIADLVLGVALALATVIVAVLALWWVRKKSYRTPTYALIEATRRHDALIHHHHGVRVRHKKIRHGACVSS